MSYLGIKQSEIDKFFEEIDELNKEAAGKPVGRAVHYAGPGIGFRQSTSQDVDLASNKEGVL